MRIKTANTLRSIDCWIARFQSRNTSFLVGLFFLGLGLARSRRALVLIPGIIIGLALHFAAIQLGVLLLIVFFVSKLYSYKIVNAFLTNRLRL